MQNADYGAYLSPVVECAGEAGLKMMRFMGAGVYSQRGIDYLKAEMSQSRTVGTSLQVTDFKLQMVIIDIVSEIVNR